MRRAGSVFLPSRWFPPSRSGRLRRLHGGRGGANGAAPGPEPGYWAARGVLGALLPPLQSPTCRPRWVARSGANSTSWPLLMVAPRKESTPPERPEFQAAQVRVGEVGILDAQDVSWVRGRGGVLRRPAPGSRGRVTRPGGGAPTAAGLRPGGALRPHILRPTRRRPAPVLPHARVHGGPEDVQLLKGCDLLFELFETDRGVCQHAAGRTRRGRHRQPHEGQADGQDEEVPSAGPVHRPPGYATD